MRSLSAAEILKAWERGLTRSPNERALELLRAAHPEGSRQWLAGRSIGRRDAELLALREWTFGAEMAAVAVCPQCEARLEITLNAAEMRSEWTSETEEEDTIALTVAGYELEFRLPNSEDLMGLSGDDDGGRKQLLDRCLISAQQDGVAVTPDGFPDEVMDAVSEQMAIADPLADIQLALRCPLCSHHWRAAFDIASFLWREIENLAGRLLRDVHAIASAYGWHERDILALSPVRRQFYLALIGT